MIATEGRRCTLVTRISKCNVCNGHLLLLTVMLPLRLIRSRFVFVPRCVPTGVMFVSVTVSIDYANTPSSSIELTFFARTQRLRSSVEGLLKTVFCTRSAFSTPSMAYIGMLAPTVWSTDHVQS